MTIVTIVVLNFYLKKISVRYSLVLTVLYRQTVSQRVGQGGGLYLDGCLHAYYPIRSFGEGLRLLQLTREPEQGQEKPNFSVITANFLDCPLQVI